MIHFTIFFSTKKKKKNKKPQKPFAETAEPLQTASPVPAVPQPIRPTCERPGGPCQEDAAILAVLFPTAVGREARFTHRLGRQPDLFPNVLPRGP